MASKAYVASMTVAELTSELKQRGLSARGKKRDLQNRLEKALEEEELSDSGSESDGNNNQQLFQQAAASYAAYQTTTSGMNNLTVSINRAEMVPSDTEIDSDPANQTRELIVSIQRSKRTVKLLEEPSNDTGGQQIELNGEGREISAVDLAATLADISSVASAQGADEVSQVANDEPNQDKLSTSEPDSNQNAEESEDVVHMQQSISSPHDFPIDKVRPSPSTSEQVLVTTLSPGSTRLPPFADDLQPSSSSSLPSFQPLLASPTEDVQPSSYSQALSNEKEPLVSPTTADIPQPSSSEPTELQPSSSISSPPLKSPLSSPPNTLPVITTPDTINQESAVSELIPTAKSLVSPQDKIPESSEVASGPSKSEQLSSHPCSLGGEKMEVSGETTEQQAVIEEESSSLAPPVSIESDDLVLKAANKEQEPDTSSIQEKTAQISLPSSQVDDKEASPSTPPPPPVEKEMENVTAPIAADSREPTSTSELPTTTKTLDVESGAASQTEDQVVTELSSVPDLSTSYVDSGKPSGEDELLLQGVVSSSGVEPAGIDADVVVPTVEEDDFSVFSAEAAEAQRLRSSAKETVSSKRRLSSGVNSVSVGASNRLGREAYERDSSQEQQKGTNSEVSGDVPVQKRRRISTSPKRISTGERKRRWGSTSGRVQLTPHAAISSDTLEDIIPEEVKAESSNQSTALDVVMSYSGDEGDKVAEERGEEEDVLDIGGKEGLIDDEYEREWRMKEKEREEQRREAERARQELETRRRIEARLKAKQAGDLAHDEEEKMDTQDNTSPRSPSPARNPPTHILHVEHLTRPFTILQLKDLLEEDGKMLEGGFWTNRIKSHCIAVFGSVDSAIATRSRIHGMKWPSTNPKLLKADYLSAREVARVSDGQLELQETSPSPQPEVEPSPVVEQRTVSPSEPSEDQPVENTDDKQSDQKPTLVLDKLFHKTKAIPPIYWLPLTDEQAKVKEDERKAIENERQRLRAERVREREKEKERSEREMRDREKRIREEREQRARDRYRRRSRSRSRSPRRRR